MCRRRRRRGCDRSHRDLRRRRAGRDRPLGLTRPGEAPCARLRTARGKDPALPQRVDLPTPVKLVVLASGSGTLLQAVLDATGRSGFPAKVVAVGAARTGIEALTRAERLSIPSFAVSVADHPGRAAR